MRQYTPLTKDIRTQPSTPVRQALPKEFYGQQYEMTFDAQSDSHLRSLLRQENRSSLSDFINS
jgi:hypothetical protein